MAEPPTAKEIADALASVGAGLPDVSTVEGETGIWLKCKSFEILVEVVRDGAPPTYYGDD